MDSDFSHRDPSSRRTQLFQSLSRLTPPEFGQLLYGIQPPAGLIPDSEAPQMKRVKALLDWAEGPTGRGTDEIWDALAQLQQGSLSSQGQALPNFQPYLQSILENKDYREWQECYTPTTVEGRKQAPQPERSRRLKLRVETVVAKDDSASGASAKPSEGEPQEKIEQFEVLEGLRQYAADHVLLIGKPGSGKSSSLEWLLWNEAGRALDDPTAKIPVLVKLRRCTSTLEALIQDFLNGHGLPLSLPEVEALLNQGKLLLLLDGLNELPANLGTEMANFRSRYRKTTPMVVSTREQSIGGTLGIAKTLKMLPLSEPQMQEFVQGYLGDEGKALFQQIKGDHLRKFAETPLLLWMLCRVFDQNGHVPSNLGMAFREFTQLYDRQIQEDAPAESRDQWPKLLRHLAFALMHDKELVDFRLSMPREEAENVLTNYLQQEGRINARENAECWLQDLLDYHLIQPVITENLEEHIEFRHQLIQEYYAAEYLLRLLPGLSDEQLKHDYLNLLKWTEPMALMLALVDEEEQALRVVKLAIDDVDLMLGSRLAGEIKQGFQSKAIDCISILKIPESFKVQCWAISSSNATIFSLSATLSHKNPSIREKAAAALGQLQSEAAILALIQALEHQDSSVRRRAAAALGQLQSEAAIPALIQALEDQDSDVRRRAAAALGKFNCEKVALLIEQILQTRGPDLRLIAIESLGRILSECSISSLTKAVIVTSIIKALGDRYPGVRRRAVQVLGEIGDPRPISLLWQHQSKTENTDFYAAISVIQNRCKFYNYEIWKEAMTIQSAKLEIQKSNQEDTSGQTIKPFPNATEVKIFERVEHYYENPPNSDQ